MSQKSKTSTIGHMVEKHKGDQILSPFSKQQPDLPTCYPLQSLHAIMKITLTILALATVALALPTRHVAVSCSEQPYSSCNYDI
jgi:hypothetical protein